MDIRHLWLVNEGEAMPLADVPADDRPDRQRYGYDWIVVEASDAADAVAQANDFDAGIHSAQTEMDLFAAAYRAGAVDLPKT